MTRLSFVSCINRPEVARRHLLSSPCLQLERGHQLVLAADMDSAGSGFRWGLELAVHDWIILLHQDVHLPDGWDKKFARSLLGARQRFPRLAVAGVYGLQANGAKVGRVYDRDRWLGDPAPEPTPVRSLDELLLAVHKDSGLQICAELGWHLYGTDLCLQAEAAGLDAVVVDAPCHHHSSLPRQAPASDPDAAAALQGQVDAFNVSASVLCRRWPQAMPVHTSITQVNHGSRLVLPAP